MQDLMMLAPRNDLESMGISGLRETVLGRPNEACCGDCRYLCEGKGATHPCQMEHGRKDLYSRFAMICPDFRLTPYIDEGMERRSGHDRRTQAIAVTVERRRGERRATDAVTEPVNQQPIGKRLQEPIWSGTDIMACPSCQSTTRQVKSGRTVSGRHRYKCQTCKRTYTPEPTASGYDAAMPATL